MRIRIALSWMTLVVGGAYGAFLSYEKRIPEDPLVAALTMGYFWWSLFWGLPVVLRWWWGIHFGPELTSRFLKLALGFVLIPMLAFVYGAFGGGLYQLWKNS